MLELLTGIMLAGAGAAIPFGEPMNGECRYSPEVIEHAAGVTLAVCNTVTIENSAISFGQRGWDSALTFHGTRDGDLYTITSLTLQNGDTVEADGSCRIHYASNRVSTVTCMAVAERMMSYAANIAVSRL